MKKLIHKYLNQTFFVEKCKIKCFSNHWFVSSKDLIEDLNKIFDLNKKELKWWVKSWVRKQSKGFDFNRWWAPKVISFDTIFMPFVTRVMSSTIVSDIISVQPMGEPTGELFYFQNADNFIPRLGIADRYGSAAINENTYESISVQEAGTASRMLNDWRNLINEQTQIENEQ